MVALFIDIEVFIASVSLKLGIVTVIIASALLGFAYQLIS